MDSTFFRRLITKSLFILLMLLSEYLFAQHQELNEPPGVWSVTEKKGDSSTILRAFKNGRVSGNFRYFFMATNNEKDYSDYQAQAAGGGLKFETARFQNWQMGVSGYYVFNIGSSDFSISDPGTGQPNRYEIGLFDLTNVHNKKNISRLEELYLRYYLGNSKITWGRQLMNNTFINLQDGRMRPTEIEGLWVESQYKKIKWEGGYLYAISPRSTVDWYSVAKSMGVYASGINPDGTKSAYAGNLSSNGILLVGFNASLGKSSQLRFTEQIVTNVFHASFLQLEHQWKLTPVKSVFAGGQLIREDALANGGNNDPDKAYFEKKGHSWVFSTRCGVKSPRMETSLNYTRITADGRYLMPREWGRDPFYTFLPRERNEGLGDVNAYVLKSQFKPGFTHWKPALGVGYFNLPSVSNYRMNKYGMPSYWQLNVELKKEWEGFGQGFDTQILYVYKGLNSSESLSGKYIINKVNMSNFNLVINFRF